MNNINKQKWDGLTPVVKLAVVVVSLAVAVVFVIKVLPAVAAGMGIGALLAVLFVPYWAPTIIAFVRSHPSKGAILAVNFFFGWTFLGWVISLIWALGNKSARVGATVVVNNTVSPSIVVGGTLGAAPPQYRVGDFVNGHRYDGISWVLEQPQVAQNPMRDTVDARHPVLEP